MGRWLGIGSLVLAAFVLFAGWATWTGFSDQSETLGAAQDVDAGELARARAGTLVAVEGVTLRGDDDLAGPVSGSPAAWYRLRSVHRWREQVTRCKALHCHDSWQDRRESQDDEVTSVLAIRVDGSKRALRIEVPDDPGSVTRLRERSSDTVDLDVKPTRTRRDDRLVRVEDLLPPGETVTVVGKVDGTGEARRIVPADDQPFVYAKPRASLGADLQGYERAGQVLVLIGVLLVAFGIWLLRRDRLTRPATRVVATGVRSTRLPAGTVLGGPDNPLQVDVRCPACTDRIRLQYGPVQDGVRAATPRRPSEPAWRVFDDARPLRDDETALDMSCSHCGVPIRVVVEPDEWRMSLWAYHLTEVLAATR